MSTSTFASFAHSIVEDEIEPAILHLSKQVPNLIHLITKNVLLGISKVFTTSRLQVPNVIFSHVDEERQVRRVSPEADLRQLVEDELFGFQLLLASRAGLVLEWLGEARRELKDGLVASAELHFESKVGSQRPC